MLHEFLTANRHALITLCREKVSKRTAPLPSEAELEYGIPLFLEQLVKTLQIEQTSTPLDSRKVSGPSEPGKSPVWSEIDTTAAKHGNELLEQGFTVDQVVHDYGDLCQAITELAVEQNAPVKTDEFRTLNRCLDNAIAGAVTEFSRKRDSQTVIDGAQAMGDLGSITHELRNLLDCAMVAVGAIKNGDVGMGGATGALLERSLIGLRNVIDRSLADVRLATGMPVQHERIVLADFVAEVEIAGQLQAKAQGRALTVAAVDRKLAVDADRQMLASAVAHVLQNALTFTRAHGHVSLKAYAAENRVLIEIEDECGGLPQGTAEKLFPPFEPREADRAGPAGLTIVQRSVEAIGGVVRVRNVPGTGCTFTIDLPLSANPQ